MLLLSIYLYIYWWNACTDWINNECNYKFNNGGKSNKRGQLYFFVIIYLSCNVKMPCNVYISAASLPYKIIFNANKQIRYVEAFQPRILVAIVLHSLFRTWIAFGLLLNSRAFHKYIRDCTFMKFTRKEGWEGVWKFVTCLLILLSLETRAIVRFC